MYKSIMRSRICILLFIHLLFQGPGERWPSKQITTNRRDILSEKPAWIKNKLRKKAAKNGWNVPITVAAVAAVDVDAIATALWFTENPMQRQETRDSLVESQSIHLSLVIHMSIRPFLMLSVHATVDSRFNRSACIKNLIQTF